MTGGLFDGTGQALGRFLRRKICRRFTCGYCKRDLWVDQLAEKIFGYKCKQCDEKQKTALEEWERVKRAALDASEVKRDE